MPNILAFLMLGIWPIVTAVMFQRLPVDRAFIWSLMLGYLFLPEPPAGFDLPLLPPFAKHNIPALSAFIVLAAREIIKDKPLLPKSPTARVLVLLFIFTPILTAVTNGHPVTFGRVYLPGLSLKDSVGLVIQQFLLLMPFFLARILLSSADSQRELLRGLMFGGLIYSIPMLIEIRLSPQLNLWVYGYYQHFFGQSVRFGGYRPVVFLYHGLWVAFFCMTSVLSTWALWRMDRQGKRMQYLAFALYMTAILVLAKSTGAVLLAMIGLPIILLLPRLTQINIAVLLASLALAYPLLKGAGAVPQDWLIENISRLDLDRAASLDFRLDNENVLLERAYEQPLFGWGSWGRNLIYDPVSGLITSVTDGRWIIVIGTFGWLGFIAEFGLLMWPMMLMRRKTRSQAADEITPFIAPLSLLLALNMIDLLPNATLTPLTFLIAGALTGYSETDTTANRPASDETQQKNSSGLKWQSIL